MMDPVQEFDHNSPPSSPTGSCPPPPPVSAPPEAAIKPPDSNTGASTGDQGQKTPPVKPKKSRRGNSPTKEENGHCETPVEENRSLRETNPESLNQHTNGIRRSPSPSPRRKLEYHKEDGVVLAKGGTIDFDISLNGGGGTRDQDDINTNSAIIDTKKANPEVVNGTTEKVEGMADPNLSALSTRGVAKIVGEIEKFNSIGKRGSGHVETSSTTPRKSLNGSSKKNFNEDVLDDVELRVDSPANFSPIEKSVLREMPVDVEIETEETAENNRNIQKRQGPRRHNISNAANNRNSFLNISKEGDERQNSPKSSVKRTPTMEFKKQCSKIVRIRTKLLQNLGKADKTTDEVFDEYEGNFTRQQTSANRLHKEVANYLRCARALHGASKALFETLGDVYEQEWSGHDLIYAQAQNSDMLWTDFVHKLQDQTLAPLTAYQIQFPDLRKKIDKRGRKLVDYDSQRHQLEALQRNNRRDEYKLARCKDQLELARSTYHTLNKDLYEELPGVYDQRVPRIAECLQTLYAAEATFMRESSKIATELDAITEKLRQEVRAGQYTTTRGTPITPRPLSYSAAVPGTNTSTTTSKDSSSTSSRSYLYVLRT
uniref:Myc box-dependent-interacting protein 1-like n=1 Tax=Hirondellea gigas TaxID=1518452 RepID=A0A2P2I2F3_9CRUS